MINAFYPKNEMSIPPSIIKILDLDRNFIILSSASPGDKTYFGRPLNSGFQSESHTVNI
jgi:hypothetical protein